MRLSIAIFVFLIVAGSNVYSASPNDKYHLGSQTNTGVFYLDVALGYGRGSGDAALLESRFDAAGVEASILDYDDDRFGWQLSLGYQVFRHFGLELHYTDLEDAEVRIGASNSNMDAARAAIDDLVPLYDAGWGAAIVGTLPLKNYWKARAKLGQHRWFAKGNRDRDTSFYASIGLDYPFSNNMRVFGEVTRFNLGQEKTYLCSIGLQYAFK